VTIAELKKVKDRRPFEPFLIRTADGREILIRHPDAVAWDLPDEDEVDEEENGEENGEEQEPLTIHCIVRGGAWEVINLDLVTSFGQAPPRAKAKGKRKAGGK
jgi:hypothetical protein